MHSTPLLLALLSLSPSPSLAFPSRTAPRNSCTTQAPSILQILSEVNPNTTFPNLALLGGHFLVSSSSRQNRTYQAVAFTDIPAHARDCSLNLIFTPNSHATSNSTSSIKIVGEPVLDIHTLNPGKSSKILSPNAWTWSDVNPTSSNNPIDITPSLFGTINPHDLSSSLSVSSSPSSSPSPSPSSSPLPSVKQTINSQACPTDLNGGGNLAFLFTVASWVGGDASIYFNALQADGLMGVYLTYNC